MHSTCIMMILALNTLLSSVSGGVACKTDVDCQKQTLLSTSTCVNRFCVNPFVSGCLDLPQKRVCSSLDQGNTQADCTPNEFDFPEIRLFPGNWESAMFTTWVAQIYLSEVLRVPVTIETGSSEINMDFYHPDNTFGYPASGYAWKALQEASQLDTDECSQSMFTPTGTAAGADPAATAATAATGTEASYKACAHAQLEVWPAGNTVNLKKMVDKKYGEIAGSIGGYGKISWYTFERVVAQNPSLKSFYGFTDRKQIASLFKRPVSWYEYCVTFKYGTCDSTDTVAQAAPADAAEGAHYFVEDKFRGYFKADDCTANPTTCTGYIVNAPCDWSTYVDAQITWSHPNGTLPLVTTGPRKDGGYSYGQMQEVYEAAGRLGENILMWWWEPESLMERWKKDPEWKLYVNCFLLFFCSFFLLSDRLKDLIYIYIYINIIYCSPPCSSRWFLPFCRTSIELPDYSESCNDIRPTHNEKCSSDASVRIGKTAGSGCANPVELLTKVFSNSLRSQLDAWDNSTRSSTGIQTPAHGFLQRLQVDTPFLKHVLYDWRYTGPDANPSGIWARDVVCRHVRNISSALAQYNPPGHPKISQFVEYPSDFIILQIFSSVGIVACLALICFVQYIRNSPKIKASQPFFLQLILFGGALVYASCILQLQDATSAFICQFRYWTLSFGWGTFFVPLLLKTYRLYAVFDAARHMKRIKISTAYLIGALCMWLVLVEGVLSLITSVVVNLTPSFKYVEDYHNPGLLFKHRICSSSTNTDPTTQAILFVILCAMNLLLVVVGVVLAIRTRNISSKFSESSQLAAMMYNSFLFTALAVVFSLLPNVDPQFTTRTNMVLMMIGLTLNLVVLFVPKFINLNDESMSRMGSSNNNTQRESKKSKANAKTLARANTAPPTQSSSQASSSVGSTVNYHTNEGSHANTNSQESSAVIEMTTVKESSAASDAE